MFWCTVPSETPKSCIWFAHCPPLLLICTCLFCLSCFDIQRPNNHAHGSPIVAFCLGFCSGRSYPYPSGLLHWLWDNLKIVPVPVKQLWRMWVIRSHESIMNASYNHWKQYKNTTKSCACFMRYSIWQMPTNLFCWNKIISPCLLLLNVCISANNMLTNDLFIMIVAD